MNINIEVDELPEEITSPITESEYASKSRVQVSHLEGLNVFADMQDGKTFIGLIHSVDCGTFMIGNHPYRLFDSDVRHSRVV